MVYVVMIQGLIIYFMTDFPASFALFNDDLLFPSFEDYGGGMEEDDDNGGQFPSAEIEVMKLTSLPFHSPLDMIIPPSQMLKEDAYETLLQASCQLSSPAQLQEIPSNTNNKLINSCEDIDSTNLLKVETDIDSKTPEASIEVSFDFQKRNSNFKGKNQYDKNIVGNICSTIIRKMLNQESLKEVKFYCQHYNVSPKEFLEYFRSFIRKNARFGTSELYNFFLRNEKEGFKSVFGLFMTRFVNEQYLLYILSAGKMDNEYKYLECATNLLYIPRLQNQQYDLISRFHQVNRDI